MSCPLTFDNDICIWQVDVRDKSLVLYDTSSWCPLKTIYTPGWVTSMSWNPQEANVVAVRSEPSCISILNLTPIHVTDVRLSAKDNEPENATTWTRDGCFVARMVGNTLVIAEVQHGFTDVTTFDTGGYVRSLAFCTAKDNTDLLAVVNTKGRPFVLRLVSAESNVMLDVEHWSFIEEHLWAVAWSSGKSLWKLETVYGLLPKLERKLSHA